MGRKNISCFYLKIPCLWYWGFVGTEFEFRPDEILHCCRLLVSECLSVCFFRPVYRTCMQVVLSAFWGFSGYILVVSTFFWNFFHLFSVCVSGVLKVYFTAYCLVVSAGFLIFTKISLWKFFWKIFGGKEKSIYLCNRKRETNAPHDEVSGSLGSEWRKSSLKDLHRQINVVQELTTWKQVVRVKNTNRQGNE